MKPTTQNILAPNSPKKIAIPSVTWQAVHVVRAGSYSLRLVIASSLSTASSIHRAGREAWLLHRERERQRQTESTSIDPDSISSQILREAFGLPFGVKTFADILGLPHKQPNPSEAEIFVLIEHLPLICEQAVRFGPDGPFRRPGRTDYPVDRRPKGRGHKFSRIQTTPKAGVSLEQS